MAAKSTLNGIPGGIADRAKAVFGEIVNDLDRLFRKLGDRIGSGSVAQRAELLKLVRTLRKSLDTRLGALERVVAGGGSKRAAAPKKKAAARKAPTKKTAPRRR